VHQCDASRKEFNRKRGYIKQQCKSWRGLKAKRHKTRTGPSSTLQRSRATSRFIAIRSAVTNALTDGQTFPTAFTVPTIVTTTNRRHVLLHSIKAYRKRNTGTAPLILQLGTRWPEWSVSRPVRITSTQGPFNTPILNRRIEEPRANIHALSKGKISFPCRKLNNSSDISP
jgi:hypothetical protein